MCWKSEQNDNDDDDSDLNTINNNSDWIQRRNVFLFRILFAVWFLDTIKWHTTMLHQSEFVISLFNRTVRLDLYENVCKKKDNHQAHIILQRLIVIVVAEYICTQSESVGRGLRFSQNMSMLIRFVQRMFKQTKRTQRASRRFVMFSGFSERRIQIFEANSKS